MGNLRFILFILWLPSLVMADCQFSDGTKAITLKNGESVSLRSPGKSLEKLKIQDQDGLSTCYANSASVVLQSILPGNPEISYTHAAVMGTTRGQQEDWSKDNNKYLNMADKEENFTSFGWVCETVTALKNSGGACPKKLSAPESKELWSADIQQRLFLGLGLYFDNMNAFKNDPKKMVQLKKDLSLAIEAINEESAKLIQQCQEKKKDKFPIYDAVKQLIEDSLYDHIAEATRCTQAKVDALVKLLDPSSVIESDRFDIKPNQETLNKFNAMLEKDPVLAAELERFLDSPDETLKKDSALVSNLGSKLNDLLLNMLPDEAVKKECQAPEGQSPFLKEEIAKPTKSFIYQMKLVKENLCQNLLQAYDLAQLLDPTKNPKSCMAPTNLDSILAAMIPLIEMDTIINQNLVPMLLNPESRYADQIVKAIMPGCLDKTKLIPMAGVECSSPKFCEPNPSRFSDNFTYIGPKGGCMELEQAKTLMRTKSLAGINQGRATAVAVCTAFMKNPEITSTKFCSGGLPEGQKHSFHEMAITGYRCQSDKIEYEIVNSWGTNCEDNTSVECQKDEYGNPIGPFWVKEDILVDNSTDFSVITEPKK